MNESKHQSKRAHRRDQQREQESFEAMTANRSHMLCKRLTAMHQRIEEAQLQGHARFKEKPRRDPWRDKPRQQRNKRQITTPKIKASTMFVVRCLKCLEEGHYLEECTSKRSWSLLDNGKIKIIEDNVVPESQPALEKQEEMLIKDDLLVAKQSPSEPPKDDEQRHEEDQAQRNVANKKEQTKNETENNLILFRESVEPKCDIPSFQTELVSKYTCEKLTSLEPVQPSSNVCSSQVPKESSPEATQTSLPLVRDLMQPANREPFPMPFPCVYQREHCKEIDLVRTEPSLFVMVSIEEEKRFGLENVKEFCVSRTVFDKMIPSFKTFTLEEFHRLKCFQLDEFRGFDSSLGVSLCDNDAYELFRTRTEQALVKTFSKMQLEFKNSLGNSNLSHKHCHPTVSYHVLESSTSSIIHLLFAKGVDKFAGTKEEPPDLGSLSFHVFARTGIGVVLVQDTKPLEYVRMIFEVGERIWTHRIYGPFHQTRRISDNAYKLNLRGKYILGSTFNDPDLVPYIVDATALRSNPFQVGEDDMILTSIKEQLVAELTPADEHEDEKIFLVPFDLMISARASTKIPTPCIRKMIQI